MSAQIMKKVTPMNRLLSLMMMAGALLSTAPAWAAAPGITTNTSTAGSFTLTAQEAFLNQPDGNQVYSWGYGCVQGSSPSFAPTLPNQTCNTMQVPGPTLIVTEGRPVIVTLTNMPVSACGSRLRCQRERGSSLARCEPGIVHPSSRLRANAHRVKAPEFAETAVTVARWVLLFVLLPE